MLQKDLGPGGKERCISFCINNVFCAVFRSRSVSLKSVH